MTSVFAVGLSFLVAVLIKTESKYRQMLRGFGSDFKGPGKWLFDEFEVAKEFPGWSLAILTSLVLAVWVFERIYIADRPDRRRRWVIFVVVCITVVFGFLLYAAYKPLLEMSSG